MQYFSTRDAERTQPRSFCDILLGGLAPDGGLYLPEDYPTLDDAELARCRDILTSQGYPALAAHVVGMFTDDIPADDLRGICERAYTAEKFGDASIVGLDTIGDGLQVLHLSNGPTAAFKDMAMQLLGELFAYELDRRDDFLTIVGATSGDTGSAAEYALIGKPELTVFMLTPAGRMTPFQQAQMFSLDDPRIVNVAVDGVFDDCQDLVKQINADVEFKSRHHIGAVNSINWARLLAQIVYYIAGWVLATDADSPREVSFAVPTGNFGNICAGHIARQMGLPIRQLVLATNENDVLREFFDTGVYRVRSAAETPATSSPSMDISKASNFERFVFDLVEGDAVRVAQLFGVDIPSTGYFDLSATPEFQTQREQYGFVSGSSTHADRLAEIARVHAESGVMIDPHTADAVHVAREYAGDEPMIVLETALPVKFAATIREALGTDPEVPERFADIEGHDRHVVDLPNDVDALKDLIDRSR